MTTDSKFKFEDIFEKLMQFAVVLHSKNEPMGPIVAAYVMVRTSMGGTEAGEFSQFLTNKGVVLDNFLTICQSFKSLAGSYDIVEDELVEVDVSEIWSSKRGYYNPVAQKSVFDLVKERKGNVTPDMLKDNQKVYLSEALATYNFYSNPE